MGHIEVNKEKGFIHVLLNYPNCTNSLTDDMIDELVERVEELEKENQNIIILSGSGKGFCSGGTLSILKGERDSKRNLFDQLEKVIKPTLPNAEIHRFGHSWFVFRHWFKFSSGNGLRHRP